MTHCGICFEWVGNGSHSHPIPTNTAPIPITVWEPQFTRELAAAEARGRQQMIDALRDEEAWDKYWRTNEYVGTWEYGRAKMADCLEAIAKQATPDTPTPQAGRDDHS